MSRRGDFIYTFSGVKFYPLDPRPEEIVAEDIAHALANICRFTGHCSRFYSVAQHSVLCSDLVPHEYKLWAPLHDASEAYLCDVPRPLKKLEGFAEFYKAAEGDLMYAVAERFQLQWPIPQIIHNADVQMLVTEQRDLMPQSGDPWWPDVEPAREIEPWTPDYARVIFKQTLRTLTRLEAAA